MVRPSINNLHEFVAEENTCFFDICLPNYTADSLRRITYFKEITAESVGAAEADLGSYNAPKTSINRQKALLERIDPNSVADSTFSLSSKIENLTLLEYNATPPKLPVDFEVAEIPYIGEMK